MKTSDKGKLIAYLYQLMPYYEQLKSGDEVEHKVQYNNNIFIIKNMSGVINVLLRIRDME
jgi:hypothetical protein